MVFIFLFIVFFILILITALFISLIKKFFFQEKPDVPSKLAKIIGPILIAISVLEWLSFILFPVILALLKLSEKDIKDVLIALLVCFFSGICGFTLSFDYFQRYYKVPKYKETHKKSEYETKNEPFIPHQFK